MSDDALAIWLKTIGVPPNGGPSAELRALLEPGITDDEILTHCARVFETGSPRDFQLAFAELIRPTPGVMSPFSFRLTVERRRDAPAGVPPWRIVVKRSKKEHGP